MKYSAPAKLNLNLHIVGRRADGYHLLESYFQLLDYADDLEIEVLKDESNIRISPSIEDLDDDDNLVVRAAKLLRSYAGKPELGAKISLTKRIPMGGGLGGGSSNAATTLLALNDLWKLNLSRNTLAELGLRLGADVPIFVHGYSAWATGIGEHLTPTENRSVWYVVLRPPVAVSTAQIFQHPELTRDTASSTVAAVLEGHCHNDCEPLVRALYPQVDEGLKWLSQHAKAQLTGTGSCIFAAFDDEATAHKVLNCKPMAFEGFVAKGIFASPINSQVN